MKFTDLGLDPLVLSAVVDAGYETPTPIQAQAIPHALTGRDVLGIAQTGTGKTASFVLPMLTLLAQGRARARMPRSLILAPTRELAAQVSENFDKYGKNLSLTKALLIGGVSFGDQDKLIDRGVDVLIATPGRLIDHFERGKLMLTGIEILVIDEADRMLDMGFIEDIERIIKLTPFTRQTLFFSATMPPEIVRLTQEFLHNPERVEVARAASTVDTIEQRLVPVPTAKRDRAEREKRRALRAAIALEGETLTNAIVFCNRKRDVGTLYKSLEKHGYNCGALHGDLDQSVRTRVLDAFRNDKIKLLIASDVAARGLDIPRVTHVFNFDVPINAEDYVHRIGRTGRAGRTGVAYTFAAPSDDKLVAAVEKLIGKPVPRFEIAGVSDRTDADVEDGDERGERRRERYGRDERPRRDDRARDDRARDERVRDERSRDERPRRDDRIDPRSRVAEPEEAAAMTVAREEPRAPRPERDDNRWRAERVERSADGRRGRSGDRRRRDEDDGPRVVGMGDHVPAFLLREVPLPTRKKADDELEDEAEMEEFDAPLEGELVEVDTPDEVESADPEREPEDVAA